MKATTQAASQVTKSRSKGKSQADFLAAQLDLFGFGDDPVAVISTVDAMVSLHEQTEAAIFTSPAAAAAVGAAGHENVDFARYMHAVGVPSEEVRTALVSEGADAEVVLDAVAAVESVEPAEAVEPAGRVDEPRRAEPTEPARAAARDENEGEDEDAHFEPAAEDDDSEEQPAMEAGDSKGASSTQLYLTLLRGKRYDAPTPEREAELGRLAMQGNEAARMELVERNMRFMVSMARRYIRSSTPFDDLLQAGADGLMHATTKFNPEKGRFTTIAGWWITQRIQRVVRKDDSMPIPAYLPYEEGRLKRQAEAATSDEERQRLLAKASKVAQRLEQRRKGALSLTQTTNGEDDGAELQELISSEAPGHEERVEQMQLVRKITEFAAKLGDERATNVFLLRAGMHPEHLGEARTLQEISEVVGISRERVRQIYTEAAEDIATAMEYWAKGPENLPDGFRRGLLSPGRS